MTTVTAEYSNCSVQVQWKLDLTHASFLHEVRDHDNNDGLLFPNHTPEVPERTGQWTLCRNVSLWLLVALHTRHTSNIRNTLLTVFRSLSLIY